MEVNFVVSIATVNTEAMRARGGGRGEGGGVYINQIQGDTLVTYDYRLLPSPALITSVLLPPFSNRLIQLSQGQIGKHSCQLQ